MTSVLGVLLRLGGRHRLEFLAAPQHPPDAPQQQPCHRQPADLRTPPPTRPLIRRPVTRNVQRPVGVSEVALQLADDRGDCEARECAAAPRVVTIDGLDKRERRDLDDQRRVRGQRDER